MLAVAGAPGVEDQVVGRVVEEVVELVVIGVAEEVVTVVVGIDVEVLEVVVEVLEVVVEVLEVVVEVLVVVVVVVIGVGRQAGLFGNVLQKSDLFAPSTLAHKNTRIIMVDFGKVETFRQEREAVGFRGSAVGDAFLDRTCRVAGLSRCCWTRRMLSGAPSWCRLSRDTGRSARAPPSVAGLDMSVAW